MLWTSRTPNAILYRKKVGDSYTSLPPLCLDVTRRLPPTHACRHAMPLLHSFTFHLLRRNLFLVTRASCLVPPWLPDGDASRCASRHPHLRSQEEWRHRLLVGLRAHVQPPLHVARHPSRSRLPGIRHLLLLRIRRFWCHHHHHVTRYQFHRERIAEPGATASLQAPRKTWLRVVSVATTRRHWQFCRRESCLESVRRLRYSPS